MCEKCIIISCGFIHQQCINCSNSRMFRATNLNSSGDWINIISKNHPKIKLLRICSFADSVATHVSSNGFGTKEERLDKKIHLKGSGAFDKSSSMLFADYLARYMIDSDESIPIRLNHKNRPELDYSKLVENYINSDHDKTLDKKLKGLHQLEYLKTKYING